MTGADNERDLLLGRLRAQRRHILDQLDGLNDDRLRTPVLPSGWTCLGLVRHLTLSDERYWFEVVMGGAPLDFWPAGENGDWRVDAASPPSRCSPTIAPPQHSPMHSSRRRP